MGWMMTEAEILESAIQSAQAGLALFSVLLSVVSGYIVALYLFLNTAPFLVRFIAFGLLTLAMLTLGALAMNLQYLGEGMHTAWQSLPQKATGMETLGPPLIVRSLFLDGREAASLASWALGSVVYLALAYATFLYRWPKTRTP
jgi:hypothetical protein